MTCKKYQVEFDTPKGHCFVFIVVDRASPAFISSFQCISLCGFLIGAAELEMAKPSEILASTTDAEAWNLEVERVAPQLKVTVRVDGRDWRSHLDQVIFIYK